VKWREARGIMNHIAFHFNVPGKLPYACRLLRKAYASGARVGVVGAAHTLQELDAALWTFTALDFIPHCAANAPADVLAATPIVLASDCAALPPQTGVLLNLGADAPAGFERFERLIELVGHDPNDRAQARLRWRYYAGQGYTIQQHDLAAQKE
jgi:DNA polymerase-3 subunit chi